MDEKTSKRAQEIIEELRGSPTLRWQVLRALETESDIPVAGPWEFTKAMGGRWDRRVVGYSNLPLWVTVVRDSHDWPDVE